MSAVVGYNLNTNGLQLYLDARNPTSYPGSGNTWYDLSPNNNNSTLTGTSYTTASGALNFNGTSSKGTFSSPTNIPINNSNYTISVWFNATSTGGAKGFIGWGTYGTINRVNALRIGGSSFVHYWWGNDIAGGAFVANAWYQVTVTYDGYWRRLYVNGGLAAQDIPGNGHAVPNANNLTIGVTNGTEFFPGKLSQILVYNTAISYSEVVNNYYATNYRYS